MIQIQTAQLSAPQLSLLSAAIARVGARDVKITKIGEKCDAKITVLLGQDALNFYYPGVRLDDAHCYIYDDMYIPAYSPKSFFEDADRSHWIDHALRKAQQLQAGRSLDVVQDLILRPTYEQAMNYITACMNSPQICIDIETSMSTHELTAIALALSPVSAISIPFAKQFMEDYWSPQDEADIWRALSVLLAKQDVKKIFQNFIFDTMMLRRSGISVSHDIDDTLIIANLLNPELPKSLADLGRMYTFAPPWKNNKDFNLTGDPEAFWRYNALDAAKTFQVFVAQQGELASRKLLDFYATYIRPLVPIVLDTCVRGMRVDTVKLCQFQTQLGSILSPVENQLVTIANPLVSHGAKQVKTRNKEKDTYGPSPKTGKKIVIEKGYDISYEPFNPRSPAQIKEVLRILGYRIPTYRGKETTDRNALLKINRKKPHEFISLLLRYSRLAKLKSSYLSLALDRDGRCRYSYNIGGTRSGRFSCQGTAWDTGLNVQTIPRKADDIPFNIKEIFIPDEGMSLVEVDLSQAELRVVAWLAREEKLIKLMEEKQDVHQFTANEIQRISGLECPRQLGKRINHASNYGMGAAKFADSCLLEADLSISVSTAQTLLAARAATFPGITMWHRQIEDTIRRTRRLISPHGRERFFYGIPNDAMFREALSFIPQATVVDTLNSAWVALENSSNKCWHVLAQIHDSLLIQVPTDKIDLLVAEINSAFSAQSITINGYQRLIPWDIKTGETWGSLKNVA